MLSTGAQWLENIGQPNPASASDVRAARVNTKGVTRPREEKGEAEGKDSKDAEGEGSVSKQLQTAIARLALQHEEDLRGLARDDNFAIMTSEGARGGRGAGAEGGAFRGNPLGKKPGAYLERLLVAAMGIRVEQAVEQVEQAAEQGLGPISTKQALEQLAAWGEKACTKEAVIQATRRLFIEAKESPDSDVECAKWIFAMKAGGQGVDAVLAIAGDGPAKAGRSIGGRALALFAALRASRPAARAAFAAAPRRGLRAVAGPLRADAALGRPLTTRKATREELVLQNAAKFAESGAQVSPLREGDLLLNTAVFLVFSVPFLYASWEFWRRIAFGQEFGTGDDRIVFAKFEDQGSPGAEGAAPPMKPRPIGRKGKVTIGPDMDSNRGRQTLSSDALAFAYFLQIGALIFAILAGYVVLQAFADMYMRG
ncbi:unnamed protein product [Prorocentrum cordatum]|uniref:Uncharacterized protein n=1 Tax=Prorocentrum cordatum TaxID=2364126 RepID=A0ABN9WVC9_9DINO|nr:unnamed protein product [Polarella glacialis]